jgi:tyrosine-protein kinase
MDLLERVGAQLAGAVLNALPRKLPAGSGWNRGGQQVGPASDLELIGGLSGNRKASPGTTADPETGAEPPDGGTVWGQRRGVPARGRAPVVNSTITAGQDDVHEDDPATELTGGEAEPARGQAQVLSITDAQPPTTHDEPSESRNLPAQRDPRGKQQHGE